VGLYRDEGVVLRTQKLGEADRIVTILTRWHGRVRAVGKGIRRTSSRFGARLEPFMRVDVQFYEGRSLDIVTQVETLDAFASGLGRDSARYTTGTAMLETAERFTAEEKEPATQQYLLLVGGLRALATGERDASVLLDAFLLRSLAVAGYAPSFDACAHCGAAGPNPYFSVPSGGMVCSTCRVSGSTTPAPETVTLLAALLSGDWGAVDVSAPRHRHEATGMTAAYLQWHLERGLRSLPLVERAPA
jgi:DNA repair protein RecO (recombination protein O)